jgi:hypothetical protein
VIDKKVKDKNCQCCFCGDRTFCSCFFVPKESIEMYFDVFVVTDECETHYLKTEEDKNNLRNEDSDNDIDDQRKSASRNSKKDKGISH